VIHERGDATLVGVCCLELAQGLLREIPQFDPITRRLLADWRGGQINRDTDVVAVGRQRLQIGYTGDVNIKHGSDTPYPGQLFVDGIFPDRLVPGSCVPGHR